MKHLFLKYCEETREVKSDTGWAWQIGQSFSAAANSYRRESKIPNLKHLPGWLWNVILAWPDRLANPSWLLHWSLPRPAQAAEGQRRKQKGGNAQQGEEEYMADNLKLFKRNFSPELIFPGIFFGLIQTVRRQWHDMFQMNQLEICFFC